jgi:uncharacterized protein YukE
MLLDGLLRFAEQIVDSAVQQLTQQLTAVAEQAVNPLQGILKKLEGGGTWDGTGAQAFSQELSSLHIPGLNVATDQINTYQQNLQRASDTIRQADQAASQTMRSLEDIFGGIIRF